MCMVKTTVMLEDDLYKELVDESVREYGSTRKLSVVINRRLRGVRANAKKTHHRLTIRYGRKLTEKDIQKAIEEGWTEAVRWSV